MISAWHLIWILPLTASLGYATALFMISSGRAETETQEQIATDIQLTNRKEVSR